MAADLILDFSTATLPSQVTYTGSGGTYRDTNGILQLAVLNTPRPSRDINGNTLGFKIEGTVTNKITSRNANPIDFTGWTLSDASQCSVVTDPSGFLSQSQLKATGVCTSGKIYKVQNASGVDVTLTSVATFAATTPHVFSIWCCCPVGTATLTRDGTSPETTTIPNGSTMTRRWVTAVAQATTDHARIIIPTGTTLYFILEQIEDLRLTDAAGNFMPSSEIVTTAASKNRALDRFYIPSLTAIGLNATQISATAVCYVDGYRPNNNQYVFAFSKDATTTDYYGPRINSANRYVYGQVIANSVSRSSNVVHMPELSKRYPVAMAYKSTETTTYGGPGRNVIEAVSSIPATADVLNIGGRNTGQDTLFGTIEKIAIYSNKYATAAELGLYAFTASDVGIAAAGQSNAEYYTFDINNPSAALANVGELAFVATMNTYLTSSRNWLVNGGKGGSALLKDDVTVGNENDWYYDQATDAFGPSAQRVANALNFFIAGGGQIKSLFISGFENDTTALSTGNTSGVTLGFNKIFSYFQAIIPSLPIYFDPMGRRITSGTPNNGYELMRRLQYSLKPTAPEKFNRYMSSAGSNTVHLSPPNGYDGQAPLLAKKGLSLAGLSVGEVDGGYITSAIQADTLTITGTVSRNMTGSQGFRVLKADNTQISVTCSLFNTNFTLTLASDPGVGFKLYYGYNDLIYITDYTQLVQDTNGVSMNSFAQNLPYDIRPAPSVGFNPQVTLTGNSTPLNTILVDYKRIK